MPPVEWPRPRQLDWVRGAGGLAERHHFVLFFNINDLRNSKYFCWHLSRSMAACYDSGRERLLAPGAKLALNRAP
jgi:hypothetical protein